jgi:hypothetical protein
MEAGKAFVVDWHGRGDSANRMHWKLIMWAREVLSADFSIEDWIRYIG